MINFFSIPSESEKEMELDPPKYRVRDDRPWHSGILTVEGRLLSDTCIVLVIEMI